MYLSDRDIHWAIENKKLIVDPPPSQYDATSIDLHLDNPNEAKIWDIETYRKEKETQGERRPLLRIGAYRYQEFSRKYLVGPPEYDEKDDNQLVGRRGNEVIVRRGGFLLWQTKERIGTPDENADLICFVNGKSTKARSGIVVHLTAPTIHASWQGKVTLEIANFGPFEFVLCEDDIIAQLTVAKITSPPRKGMQADSTTYGQSDVGGASMSGE